MWLRSSLVKVHVMLTCIIVTTGLRLHVPGANAHGDMMAYSRCSLFTLWPIHEKLVVMRFLLYIICTYFCNWIGCKDPPPPNKNLIFHILVL